MIKHLEHLTKELFTPKRIFIFICLVYLIGFFTHAYILKKTVYGDGIYYFSWLKSIVIDHDIDFSDEFTYFNGMQQITTLGTFGNKYSIGPAVLWLPTYIMIHNVVKGNGYELPYQIVIGATSVFYTLIGLLLLYRILLRLVSEKIALITICAISFSTHLLFYGSLDTVNSHALSFFSVGLFISLLFTKHISWIALGITLGLTTIIRPQDSIVGLLLITKIPTLQSLFTIYKRKILLSDYIRHTRSFLFGFITIICIQFVLWRMLYGLWIFSPYISETEGFNFFRPQISSVLFNSGNGLFLYTPLFLISLIGFFLSWKKVPYPKWILAVILFLQLYIVSSWSTPSQGASYSGRMFISTLPIFAIPLSIFFSKIATRMSILSILLSSIIPLSFINCVLILYTLVRQY